MICPQDFELVEPLIDRVLTQYRESPKLLHLARTYLRQAETVNQAICDLPSFFALETAAGDQLTILGLRMGFPRTHCVCDVQPVFGFDCSGGGISVDGFCVDVTWDECSDLGVSYITIENDDLYRKFLRVRRFQMTKRFTRESLESAIRIFWDDDAMVMDARNGEVVLAPGRALTAMEQSVVQLYPRALPVAMGIRVKIHFGPLKVFGFGDGWGGFCDAIAEGGEVLLTENDEPILTETDEQILTDGLDEHSDWMCPVDVRPYDC